MGSGGKGGKGKRNSGGGKGFRSYRNDGGGNKRHGHKGKGGKQRQGYNRDRKDYRDEYDEEDDDYNDEEAALDVEEVCRAIADLPNLPQEEKMRESRNLYFMYFDTDAHREAFLQNFPPESEERQSLQSALEVGLPCFARLSAKTIVERLNEEGFDLEDPQNATYKDNKQRAPARGSKNNQKISLQKRSGGAGQAGNRGRGGWESGAKKRHGQSVADKASTAPWNAAVGARRDGGHKGSKGGEKKPANKPANNNKAPKLGKVQKSLLTKAKMGKQRKMQGGKKGLWQEQGRGDMKGITGANLITVAWKPAGAEDDDDEKEKSKSRSPSPVRQGPAGRGRSTTAPAWMKTRSATPAITDGSAADERDADMDKPLAPAGGGRGSRGATTQARRDSSPPSIPRENGEKDSEAENSDPLGAFYKERDVEEEDGENRYPAARGKKKKGWQRNNKRSRSRKKVVLRQNSAQEEATDRRDDWDDNDSRNPHEDPKDESWRGSRGPWKESRWNDNWYGDTEQEEPENKVAVMVTTFLCAKHNVKRSFQRLTLDRRIRDWVCKPGEPCRLERDDSGQWTDSLDCRRDGPPPWKFGQGETLEPNGHIGAVRQRSRSPRLALEDNLEIKPPLTTGKAKSLGLPPSAPSHDRDWDATSSAAGRSVTEPLAAPPPPPPAPPRGSRGGSEAVADGKEHRSARDHRDRERREPRDRDDRDRRDQRDRNHRDREHREHRDRDHRDREHREHRDQRDRGHKEHQEREHHSLPPGPPIGAAPGPPPMGYQAFPPQYPMQPPHHGMPPPHHAMAYQYPPMMHQGHYQPLPPQSMVQPPVQQQPPPPGAGGRDPKGAWPQAVIDTSDI